MNETKQYHFILIDDSKLDSFIGEKVIQSTAASASANVFMDAQEALNFIINTAPANDGLKTIVLVDIQMPLMTGFEFIEAFEAQVPEEKQKNYIINLLSSSINENDMARGKGYKSVNTFLSKPIKKDTLETMLKELL
jgi:CheY-like chemotaxis protein